MKIIAIVGFGFCGRLALFHLTKKPQQNVKIIIFDKNGLDSSGTAFSEFSPHYILNVPANKMSAFSDEPKSFCDFLEKKYPEVFKEIGENGFAPRHIYGEYLQEITQRAFENAKKNSIEVEFINSDVKQILKPLSLSKGQDDDVGAPNYNTNSVILTLRQAQGFQDLFTITDTNNQTYEASEILLATSFTQSNLPFELNSKNLIKKLWDVNSLEFHQRNFTHETICLIGSGLTAVDIILGLKKKNFAGKIFVISRRGNFPKEHFENTPTIPDIISVQEGKRGIIYLCLKIRNFLRANPQYDLRHVIDSIRPITKRLWRNFDEKNKKLFLRILPYWNIFRHRAPISSIESIEEMIDSGQIEIKKRGLKNLYQADEKIIAEVQGDDIECDYVVNCLGFEFKAQKYLLLAQMLEEKLLKKDLFLTQSNNPNIHLLGGLNIGRDFECTSVPDLRVSVEDIIK